MTLENIIKGCRVKSVSGDTGMPVSGITSDSRKAGPGVLFIAVRGCGNDGHAYIGDAIAKGSPAVMCEDFDGDAHGATVIYVNDSSEAVALAADNFYGHPSGNINLVGITGTNGKTTTATLLYNMFNSLGYRCGLLSTIANYVYDEELETANTTSDPITINSLLSRMIEKGCTHCFMEVSSIGLHQNRVLGLDFKVAVFSNLTHDHLDYHGTFAEYLRCKKLLFDRLGPDSCAIINLDDRNGEVMLQNCRARAVTYSCRRMADHSCRIMEQTLQGMLVRIDGTEVWTMLAGAHNAYNLLAIYSTAVALGIGEQEAIIALSTLKSARGRLEVIAAPRGINVVIDYAHTPDALDNILKTLRDTAPEAHLCCLFGCGGDRDRTKRPEMAAVAEKYSDRIIVTSDNSRTENTEDIMEEICRGFSPNALGKVLRISDRREAIRTALVTCPDGATVLLAGKGHETYQIIGKQKTHFDEREIVYALSSVQTI